MEQLEKIFSAVELKQIFLNICTDIQKEYQQKKNDSKESVESIQELEKIWMIINGIEFQLRHKKLFRHQYFVQVDLAKAFELSGIIYSTTLAIKCKDKIEAMLCQKYDMLITINYPKKILEFTFI